MTEKGKRCDLQETPPAAMRISNLISLVVHRPCIKYGCVSFFKLFFHYLSRGHFGLTCFDMFFLQTQMHVLFSNWSFVIQIVRTHTAILKGTWQESIFTITTMLPILVSYLSLHEMPICIADVMSISA